LLRRAMAPRSPLRPRFAVAAAFVTVAAGAAASSFRGGEGVLSRDYPECHVQDWPEKFCAVREFWKTHGGERWYEKGGLWWDKNSEASEHGVLNGFEALGPMDVNASASFLKDAQARRHGHETKLALDVGAGIGRVTKHLLSTMYDKVDLLEGSQKMLDAAPGYLGDRAGRLGHRFRRQLRQFVPPEARASHYDAIWAQWVVIYLTDDDFVEFLKACAKALKPGGIIVIKENVLFEHNGPQHLLPGGGGGGSSAYDGSVTRSSELMEHIFARAGLKVDVERAQHPWPTHMYPVTMWALVPCQS